MVRPLRGGGVKGKEIRIVVTRGGTDLHAMHDGDEVDQDAELVVGHPQELVLRVQLMIFNNFNLVLD